MAWVYVEDSARGHLTLRLEIQGRHAERRRPLRQGSEASCQSRLARKFKLMTIAHDRIRNEFLEPNKSNRNVLKDGTKQASARVTRRRGGTSDVSDR